ncbi:MAG: tetratricopeptide repeat protein [Planctomycetia bacterium]|nr:tetratricopeptide repeat protein [Planctomycetia bacterium]
MAKLKKVKRTEAPLLPIVDAGSVPTSSQRLFADLRIAAACLLLAAATYATYRESLSGRLFFDDHVTVETNTHVHALVNPLTRWKWATWVKAATSAADTPLTGRPVVSLSFSLNHWWAAAIYPSSMPGFEGHLPVHTPFFHYVNLAIHILVTWALFAMVRRTLQAPNFGGRHLRSAGVWAFCIALIWAVHPLNTEAVVYLTQRTEQVVSLFLLLTLYCAARALDARSVGRRRTWEVAAVVACVLGMGSKENMIAAPLLLLAYDRAFRFPDWRTTLRSRPWFYLAIAATWGVLAYIMWHNPRGSTVGFQHEHLPWYEYLITQCWCLWRYFWLTLFPLGSQLCVDYGRRPVLEFQHTAPGALLVFTLLGVTAWGWLRRPWIGFLGTWFFLILAPTSSFYPIVTEVGAERRMYLPSAAILIGLVAAIVGLGGFVRALGPKPRSTSSFDRVTAIGLLTTACAAALLGYTSHNRNKVYQNDLTLYGHIVDVFPWNDRGHSNYGKVCVDHRLTDRALDNFNRAVAIDPEYIDAFTNRAVVFIGEGRRRSLDLSIADSSEALNLQYWNTNAMNNRASAYMLSKIFDRALADFKTMIAYGPTSFEARFGQANVYLQMGETDPKYYLDALNSIEEALRINPRSYRCYSTRAAILVRLERPEEAVLAFNSALEMIALEARQLPPESADARSWKAVDAALLRITADRRTVDESLREATLPFPHRVTMAAIFNNRADANRRAAKLRNNPKLRERALDDLSRAIFLDDANPNHYLMRGEIYLEKDRYGEAMLDFDQAVTLAPNWIDALRGRIQTATKMQNFELAAQDAERLRKLRVPLDEATNKLVDDAISRAGRR